MPFVQRHPMLAALAVVAALLAVIIALELALGSTTARIPEASRAGPPESKLLPPIVTMAPEQAYPETAARPLFTPTRRPAPEAPTQQSAMVKGQFILQGVTIHGDTRIALLREKASGRTHRIERGRDVNGLTLASVEPDRVVLAQGPDREELVLTVQKGPPAPPQPVPAPGAAGTIVAPPPQAAPLPNPFAPPVGHAITGAGPFAPPGYNPAPQAPSAPVQPAQGAQSSTAPLTPEELLARRRARRSSGIAQ